MKKAKVKSLILFNILITLFLSSLSSSLAWENNFIKSDSHFRLKAKAHFSSLKVSELSQEKEKKKEEEQESKSVRPEIFIVMVYLLTVGASIGGIFLFYFLRDRMFD